MNIKDMLYGTLPKGILAEKTVCPDCLNLVDKGGSNYCPICGNFLGDNIDTGG